MNDKTMPSDPMTAAAKRLFRCDWCWRFYASSLPEGSACPHHIAEHNKRLQASIARHNLRLKQNGER